MKTCKIKPSESMCSMCLDTLELSNGVLDCKNCCNERYEILEFGVGFFGNSALVNVNGKIEKISIDRLYDIKGV